MQKGVFNPGDGKKKKKPNQEPTEISFWRNINALTNANNPRKKVKKPYFYPPKPTQSTIPTIQSFQPIFPELIDNINAGGSGNNFQPRNPGQNSRPGNPRQAFWPPRNTFQQNNLTPVMQPNNPGQNIRPNLLAKTFRPRNMEQNIRVQKPTQYINPWAAPPPGNIIMTTANDNKNPEQKPFTPEEQLTPVTNSLGPMFKPINQEKEDKKADIFSNETLPVKPKEPEIEIKKDDKPVEKTEKNTIRQTIMSQQKKILMFQMRLQTMQQEKQKQVKASAESETSNTNIGPSVGVPNVANVGMPNVGGPIPNSTQNFPTFGGVPHPSMTNVTSVPHQPVAAPTTQQSVRPQSEAVETVFNYTAPTNSMPPDQWTHVDAYGYRYPKGIPKSFLAQARQQSSSSQTALSEQPEASNWCHFPPNAPNVQPPTNATSPLMVQTEGQADIPQPYSPSELYTDIDIPQDESDSTEKSGQKRLSAFRRLGPQTQTKKPKLTISVTVNDDQEVREVVDETEEIKEITPVHLREDILLSTDHTVMRYLKYWPWKRNVVIKRSVTARNSKTVMILEKEQMEEVYEKESIYIQVTVTGYPPNWTKEQVLDTLMENVRGYSFIPCFIEFNYQECKFLTLRCRSALLNLHKCGFTIRKGDVELIITLGQTELTLNQIDFVPRLILRKRLNMCIKSETLLDLSAFTLKEDISHFLYFPLNRLNNQTELVQLQSEITWNHLTELNLSHNRLTSLDGFDLEETTPNLQYLNLSHNCLERITLLIKCRELPLNTIHLEGNPFCTDYIDPDQYVKVVKMMFPSVMTIDDIPVKLKGDMPKFIRNYCPEDAKDLAEKFLEVYFPLLDGDIEHRVMLSDMYEDNAIMTITYHYKLAFGPIYRCFRTLFQNARQIEEGNMTMVKGSAAIVKTIASWPRTEHDPFTFTVDVMFHNDTTTILRIDGILKLTRESLAEDEHLLSFTRTLVLNTRDGVEYKIQSEMLHWNIPSGEYGRSAFAVTAVKTKHNLKVDATTDEKLQGELLKIFMKLTAMDKKVSERCLEIKKWNLKEALDHFSRLLKLDSLESIAREDS
ncbi:uncharacterized protein LOC142977264 isoform X2 [Anticarsia gemmatalis]|uniref:uncharacterized protein LOC142977264 isoform X2 n=1 Tax=Anticarsia gemmatalis TaxID=129554 RepID=UPI003F7665EC